MSRNGIYLNITIDGEDYSPYLSFPYTVQKTLDETLDTAMLTLHYLKRKEPFEPFLSVRLGNEAQHMDFIIASDNVTELFGQNRYHHELTLIEETKYLERFIMGAKSYNNSEARDYSKGVTAALFSAYTYTNEQEHHNNLNNGTVNPSTYVNPYVFDSSSSEKSMTIYSFNSTFSGVIDEDYFEKRRLTKISVFYNPYEFSTNEKYEQIVTQENLPNYKISLSDQFSYDNVKEGCYIVRYFLISNYTETETCEYYDIYFNAVDMSGNSTWAWTVLDVLHNMVYMVEPLRLDETTRFSIKLTEKQQQLASKTIAPEFKFPSGRSLWENLREVGKFMHWIPRLEGKYICFDELGATTYADLSKGEQYASTGSFSAGDYAKALESSVQNLINADDVYEGSIVEPYRGGGIGLRSENARVKEEDSFIPTTRPIAKILNLTFIDEGGGEYDITPYLFEKTEYDLLTGYSGVYPTSKTFGIYYTQGSRNIYGLWYRAQDSALEIFNKFQKYSIVNIIEAVTGRKTETLPLAEISFRITYIPLISARVRQYRQDFKGAPNIIAYNQSANKLSAKDFGENLRGQIAMLGTTGGTVSYIFMYFKNVPSPGMLYNDTDYISTVTTKIYNDFCLCQIGLSTGFNELGAYVELKNDIRQFEIPEEDERHFHIDEFCVIGKNCDSDPKTLIDHTHGMNRLLRSFSTIATSPITCAHVRTLKANHENLALPGEVIRDVTFPAFGTSLGNSIFLGFRFNDNFSAGSKAVYLGEYKPMQTEYVSYGTPGFSRVYALDINLSVSGDISGKDRFDIARSLPDVSGDSYLDSNYPFSTRGNPFIWAKEPSEGGDISYQLHFVSNDGYIIGTGLAEIMSFVRPNDGKLTSISYYSKRINQITGEIGDSTSEVYSTSIGVFPQLGYLKVNNTPTVPFESWAVYKGDKFLFGKNSKESPEIIYFNFKRTMEGT